MSAKRSVLFDARLVLERPTGIGRYIVSLLPALCAAAPHWTFHVLRRAAPWPGYGFAEWSAPNVVHRISAQRHMSLAQHFTLPRLARDLGVDVLHYPHLDAPVLWGRVPVVATIHDAKELTLRRLFGRLDGVKRWYLRRCFEATLRRSTAVIAVSHATEAELRRAFGNGSRVHVVPEAADRSFQPSSPEVVKAFRARRRLERPFILCVGEFRPHKNHAGLIRAFAASRAVQTHDLVLVGQRHDGDVPPEQEAEAAGITSRTHILTDVSSEELVAAYTAASAFALVSLHEGFGLPILEAMACGAPAVVSRTTAAGEVAGDAALLVEPTNVTEIASALDRILGDPQEAARLRAAGFERAKRFTWEETARMTLAVYEEVLGRAT